MIKFGILIRRRIKHFFNTSEQNSVNIDRISIINLFIHCHYGSSLGQSSGQSFSPIPGYIRRFNTPLRLNYRTSVFTVLGTTFKRENMPCHEEMWLSKQLCVFRQSAARSVDIVRVILCMLATIVYITNGQLPRSPTGMVTISMMGITTKLDQEVFICRIAKNIIL